MLHLPGVGTRYSAVVVVEVNCAGVGAGAGVV